MIPFPSPLPPTPLGILFIYHIFNMHLSNVVVAVVVVVVTLLISVTACGFNYFRFPLLIIKKFVGFLFASLTFL